MITWFAKNYFNFSGRASRKEYWLFFLGMFTFAFAFSILSLLLEQIGQESLNPILSGLELFIECIIPLILFIPYLAVTIRRLHDTNRKGAWLLISLIPILGHIWMLILLCTRGNQKTNRYGPSPYSKQIVSSS